MIRCIVVDDEPKGRETLKNLVEQYCEGAEVIDQAQSAEEAYKLINERKPDLVFLDIEMPHGNGFDLLEMFDKIDFKVIFVTAYDQYAIKAIRFSALDYLLKPINIDELQGAVEKVRESMNASSSEESNKFRTLLSNLRSQERERKLAVPDNEGIAFISLQDIIRCESDGNYTTIILVGGKKVVASKTLKEFDTLLEGDLFFRTHRSHLINIDHLVKYVRGEGGYVIMSDKSEVEVARRKKNEFMEKLSLKD